MEADAAKGKSDTHATSTGAIACSPCFLHPPPLRSPVCVQALAPAAQDAASVLNPLFRWLAREAKLAAMLLEQVHAQLVAVDAVCSGAAKATNTQRDLMSALSKGALLPSPFYITT